MLAGEGGRHPSSPRPHGSESTKEERGLPEVAAFVPEVALMGDKEEGGRVLQGPSPAARQGLCVRSLRQP